MIIIIGPDSATIDVYTELKQVLEDTTGAYKDITHVTFTQDITQPNTGTTSTYISVPLLKPEVVIDCGGFTYTTAASTSAYYSIHVEAIGAAAEAMHITLQNGTVIGQNYYGALCVYPEGNNYRNVTLTYKNITYTGQQSCYNRYGLVEYIDCNVNVTYHEIAEANRVRIGGTTSIIHSYAIQPFWFAYNGDTQFFEIADGADVTISTQNALLNCLTSCRFVVGAGARLHIDTVNGICYGTGSRLGQLWVKAGATFTCTMAGNTYPMFYIGAEMTVEEGAEVQLIKSTAGNPVLNFSGTTLTVRQPRLFLLRAGVASVITLTGTSTFNFTVGQINGWTAPPTDGGIDDKPTYSWFRPQPIRASAAQEATTLTGTITSTAFTVADTNLTADDLVDKALSLLRPNQFFAFSMGQLPLWVNPIALDGYPVFGATAASTDLRVSYNDGTSDIVKEGIADTGGAYRVDTGAPLVLDTAVVVRASLPYLLSEAVRSVVEVGALTLSAPPEFVVFSLKLRVAQNPIRYGRLGDVAAWALAVTDTRARSTPWRLLATAARALTSYDASDQPRHTLPGALIFVHEDGTAEPFGELPVAVWSGTGNDGDLAKLWTTTWVADRGILMTTSTNPFWVRDHYTTHISWSLEAEA